MGQRRAEAPQGLQMRCRPITLMLAKAVAGMVLLQLQHQGIAMGLGEDGCCTDAWLGAIAADHSFDAAIWKKIKDFRRLITIDSDD